MLRHILIASVATGWLSACCLQSESIAIGSGGAGASEGAGSSTAAHGGSSTSGGTASTSGSGSGAGSTTGSSSGATGARGCGNDAVWAGVACVWQRCLVGDQGANCLIADGGIGHCWGTICAAADFNSDPSNCGAFGGACPAGSRCVGQGTCEDDAGNQVGCDADGGCPPGLACDRTGAYPACDLLTCSGSDDYHVCQSTQGNGYTSFCCGTKCTSLFTDSKNCGYCGHACPGGSACIYGVCDVDCAAVPTNTPCYEGYGECCDGVCQLPDTGPTFTCSVAACDGTCSGGAKCEGSYCPTTDADGLMQTGNCCRSACVNLSVDPSNCGACGHLCPAGDVCLNSICETNASCQNQTQTSSCRLLSGEEGMCCGGACVDIETDEDNCGSCGEICPSGSTCTPSSASVWLKARCERSLGVAVSCEDAGCPGNTVCGGFYGNGLCEPSACGGRDDGAPCGGGGHCCGGACTSYDTDSSNCGMCGNGCPDGSVCELTACENSDDEPEGCETSGCPEGTGCVGVRCPLIWPNACAPKQCLQTSCGPLSNGDACAQQGGALGTCCGAECVPTVPVYWWPFSGPASPPPNTVANCGACGLACDGGMCLNGVCTEVQTSLCEPACAADQICAQESPFYTFPIPPTGICVSPVCGLFTPDWPGLTGLYCLAQDGNLGLCCMDGSCPDPASDRENCGTCGNECPAGSECIAGSCR